METNLNYLAGGLGFLMVKAKRRNRIMWWCDLLVGRHLSPVLQEQTSISPVHNNKNNWSRGFVEEALSHIRNDVLMNFYRK